MSAKNFELLIADKPTPLPPLPPPGDEWMAIRTWAATLTVPSGPLAGKPMNLDDWQQDFLRGALDPNVREAGLSVARKNGKSGLVAIILLAYLAGPLRRKGFRGIVCSLTGRLAQELWHAMPCIAKASQLGGLQFKRLI